MQTGTSSVSQQQAAGELSSEDADFHDAQEDHDVLLPTDDPGAPGNGDADAFGAAIDEDSSEGGLGDASSGGESDVEEDEQPAAQASGQILDDDCVAGRKAGGYGCIHYRRRCKLVAPCCSEAFWCRHCHNAEKSENQQDPDRRHEVDRKQVVEVVCALCHTQQPAARNCNNCHVSFGRYSCLICKFYDDDLTKEQFHCDQCGICRVGGRSNYFHCRTCNCCYAMSLRDSHVCIENSMHRNCPVCYEYLFDSIKAINVMPCGHTIHNECLRGLADHVTYICPVCSKSYMPADNMNRIWEDMDQAVAATPMPQEYAETRINILCNDCNSRSLVPFHVLVRAFGTCVQCQCLKCMNNRIVSIVQCCSRAQAQYNSAKSKDKVVIKYLSELSTNLNLGFRADTKSVPTCFFARFVS